MGDVHHCSGPPVSEMTYTVSNGTLNSSIPYHTIPILLWQSLVLETSDWDGLMSPGGLCPFSKWLCETLPLYSLPSGWVEQVLSLHSPSVFSVIDAARGCCSNRLPFAVQFAGGRQIVEFCVYRKSFQSSPVTWYDIREGERRTTRFARQQRRPGSIGRFPLSGVKRSTESLSLSAFRWSITAPPRPDDELIALRLD